MITAFLPPYAFRGLPAPYLWVFYRLLHSIDEPMTFILSSDYLTPASELEAHGRAELDIGRQRGLGYVIPDATSVERHTFRFMDDGLMRRLLPTFGGNPLEFFKAFLQRDIPELRDELIAHFRSLPETPEVVLSWCNCPSLERAAAECGTRVAFMEMGPLREPMYRGTAYFDFSGVNGNTEAQSRYEAFGGQELAAPLDLATLRRSMMLEEPAIDSFRPKSNQGVVLQVEDDSNLLCYGGGFDNTSLLARALFLASPADLLIRPHPGSRFELGDPSLTLDSSPSSAVFVQQCLNVLTINSSVGLEALMYGVPVEALGDSSYAFIVLATDERERLRRLTFYLFAYLVPFDEIFSADYIRFRLGAPSEAEIMARHIGVYSRQSRWDPDLPGGEPVTGMVTNFLRGFSAGTKAIERYRQAGAPRHGISKLYFRGADQHYSEERAIECYPLRDRNANVARFRLPPGVRPVGIRFDPASAEGIYVISAVSWADITVRDRLDDHVELTGLFDFGRRIVSCGDRLFSEPGRLPVKVLASSDDPFVELAVEDLWALAGEDRVSVVEFRFHLSEGQQESIYGFADIKDRLARIERQLGSDSAEHGSVIPLAEDIATRLYGPANMEEGVLRERLDRIEAMLGVLQASLGDEGIMLEAVRTEVERMVGSMQEKRGFWKR